MSLPHMDSSFLRQEDDRIKVSSRRRYVVEYQREDVPQRCSYPSASSSSQRPRRPVVLVAAICLLGAVRQRGVTAQPCPVPHVVSEGSGACHCWPRNMTTCCGVAAAQAMESCLEYNKAFRFSKVTCRAWPRAVQLACDLHCGDNSKMAAALYDQCKFSMQFLNNLKLSNTLCDATTAQFKDFRYSIGCEYNATNCTGDQGNPQGDQCMEDCGNYANCNCRTNRESLWPDQCFGTTILQGPISVNSTTNHSCLFTPKHCQNHIEEGAACNKYRLCKPDLCFIKKVVCPPLDQCTKPGVCEKTSGRCFYANQDDGYPCDDGFGYTVNDQCINGFCKGTVDYCIKHNVTCPLYTECLQDGICHPQNGRCSYTNAKEGHPCDDHREYTVEDRCTNGFCLGRSVDLCIEAGVNCAKEVPNGCHAAGTCDPRTGKCSLPIPLSNQTCDDGDSLSFNDTCIDGLCVGYAILDWPSQKFETLGEGRCTDRSGRLMPGYTGDVDTEEECEILCREDRQCVAFSYSPPACTLHGTVRAMPPMESTRDWAWEGGSVPMAVLVEVAEEPKKGQREVVCRKKDQYGDTVLDQSAGKVAVNSLFAPLVLVVFFFALMLMFCMRPILKCIRTCLCGERKTAQVAAENRLVAVQSSPNAEDFPASPHSRDDGSPAALEDLRKAAQLPIEPMPGDPPPDAPDSPPHDLMLPGEASPDALAPTEALSPIEQQPFDSPDLPPPSDDGTSVGPKKKWSRAAAKKKQAWKGNGAGSQSGAG